MIGDIHRDCLALKAPPNGQTPGIRDICLLV
jgi:hypothetical protein